jgi:hypothetical protein
MVFVRIGKDESIDCTPFSKGAVRANSGRGRKKEVDSGGLGVTDWRNVTPRRYSRSGCYWFSFSFAGTARDLSSTVIQWQMTQ